MGVSVACSSLPKKDTEGEGTVSGSVSGLTNITDRVGDALNTEQFLNEELLNSAGEAPKLRADGKRKIIVEFSKDSLLDTYLADSSCNQTISFSEYVNSDEGKDYAQTLEREQSSFLRSLSSAKTSYELTHTYTSILNGVAIVVDDEDVASVGKMKGVERVIYSETYAEPAAEATINEVDVYGTGIYDSSDISYKGDGILVAVLDTGFDKSHRAFQEMPSSPRVSKEDIEEVFSDLEATTQGERITINDVYYNTKVPFAYDYADNDPDVFPKSSSHGMHVAGIIAGKDESATVADGEAFENEENGFIGVAPNAQLMICKVFPDREDGTEGGAETDDVLAALSDCITVGVDVINMSLGTSAGFSRFLDDTAINEVYDSIYAAGINLVVAASNSGSSASYGSYGSTNLTGNPDSGTVGWPSTYTEALSVASVSGQKSSYIELSDGTAIYFNEASNAAGEAGDFVAELLGGKTEATFNFVVVPGYGYSYNYTSAVMTELAKGNCIAVVQRGESSFEEKQEVAFQKGAIACIIYNNVSGKISASLGTGKKIPTCTVTAEVGQELISRGSGTLYFNKDYKAGPFMSQFSSWGPTNDLSIKPEITAHGGEITSSVVGGYNIYSGTSMASPNMAGAVSLLRQHVSETYGLTGVALASRVNQLLMSTATILYDENGLPYSVRRQGAGLGDISKAIRSDSYLYVEGNSKPKLELGDDPERTGNYTMTFHVVNTSDSVKTYTLGVIAMTESVSIDEITVAERAYMLDEASRSYRIDGKSSTDGKVTLQAGEDVEVEVTLTLSASEKRYIEDNFKNGMYVEGYVTLTDADAEGVSLSLPYLAFYGDWLDAQIYDYTLYEVSAEKYDTSIKDEDKIRAAVYESMAIGRYQMGSELYVPLGQYLYDMEGGADSGIESSVDKIAVGNSEYGIYEFYAVYFGLLRSVDEMNVVVTNSVTGEVVWKKDLYNIGKAYEQTAAYAKLEFSPYELGLQSNVQYTVTFTSKMYYKDRVKQEVEEFAFYADYEYPVVMEDTSVRFEYDSEDNSLRHAYLDLYLYDNHYVQAVQLFTNTYSSSNVDWATDDVGEVDWLTEYSIPVDSTRGSVNKVTVEITDYLDAIASVEGDYANCIGIRVDDYALNGAAYIIPIEYPEVNGVDIRYDYRDSNGDDMEASLAGSGILMQAGSALDLTEDVGTVLLSDGTKITGAEFSIDLFAYATYTCTHVDEHGKTCSFVYDEKAGLTYKAGDYYYDKNSGKVVTASANALPAGYEPGTLFTEIIATQLGKGEYESNHFVCPVCGTEATFTYDRRNDRLNIVGFEKTSHEPMRDEVVWKSDDEGIVRVERGNLYAVSAGTATITAYPKDVEEYEVFTFTVTVEGQSTAASPTSITVGSYDNVTLGNSRLTTGGYASVECGSELILYPDFDPWYIDGVDDIQWSANSDIIEFIEADNTHARILCKQPATGGVTIYLQSGNLIGSFVLYIGEEYTVNGIYCYEYNGAGYTEVYEGRKMLVIPSNLGITTFGYPVAETEGIFEGHTGFDTVIIPEGTTTLGNRCFADSSVRRVYLPSTLINIASGAFDGCEALEEIYWYDASEDSTSGIVYDPDNNTYNWDKFFASTGARVETTSQSLSLGSYAFRGCANLSVMDFAAITAVYDGVFEGCAKITQADLSDVRYSGDGVFENCTNLAQVTLSAQTEIGSRMFAGTAVKEIEYLASILPAAALEDMPALETVVFKGADVTVGDRALRNASKLNAVLFENGCASLGSFAFENCSALLTVTMGGSSTLSHIGEGVFKGCTSLKSISLSSESELYKNVTSDGYTMLVSKDDGTVVLVPPAYPLAEAESITVGAGKTAIGAQAYADNLSLAGKAVIIADGVKSIGAGAFENVGMVSVTIPASVTDIDERAFAGCTDLQSVLFLNTMTEIPAQMFEGCTSLRSVQLPDETESIGNSAFAGSGLTSFTVGKNVKTISAYAFEGCADLAALSFAEDGAISEIGASAFENCVSLAEISLADTVSVLGFRAFAGCTALESAYISSSLSQMGAYAFTGDTALASVTFGDGALLVGDFAFSIFERTEEGMQLSEQSALTSVLLPQSVQTVGAYAFAGCTSLTSVNLSGAKTVGAAAFMNTTSLRSVTLGENTAEIGASAFENSAVSEIDLSKVKVFGDRSFYASEVTQNSFPSAETIGKEAFFACYGIAGTVSLPAATDIGDYAFAVSSEDNVTGMISSVSLGDSLVSLGGGAFQNSVIRQIVLPASLEKIGDPVFANYKQLQRISVDAENKTFFVDTATGGLYKTLPNGTYELVAVPNGLRMETVNADYTKLQPFVILDNTSRIGNYAMAYCTRIHAVQIPASVKTIGVRAFYYMGMDIVVDAGSNWENRLYCPKYIFCGLEAPVLEASYSTEEAPSFIYLYATFSYEVGYQWADMIIPVNSKGFESTLYSMFFYESVYSPELIEESTQALVDWLVALDVDALTLADEMTVSRMNADYIMMSAGQQKFVEPYLDKLNAAVAKIAELKGPEGTDPTDPTDPDPETPGGCGGCGGTAGASFGVLACALLLVGTVFVLVKRKHD